MNHRFIGKQIVYGCAFYVAIAMGCMGIYVTSVAQLPDVYHISITELGTLGTLMSVTCMIGSALLVTIKKRIGARGCLYLGSIVMLIQAFAVFFFRENLVTLFIELVACGLVASVSAQTVLSGIISNWYVEKRAEKIAVMLGAAPFGSAFYQFVSGQILGRFDYFSAVSGLSLINGILMFFLVHFVIHAEQPEEIGQRAFGDEQGTSKLSAAASTDRENTALTDHDIQSDKLYATSGFWFLLIATMLAAGNTTYVLNYATMFFTEFGMNIGTAAALLSFMSLGSGLFSFISGRLLQKLRVKRFLYLLVGASVAANLGMVLYNQTGSSPVIILIIVSYGIGAIIPTVANLISGELFSQKDAMNVASKCYAAYAGTNIILAPACAAVIDHMGFSAAFCFVAVLCGTSLVFYLLAIKNRKRFSKTI